MALSRLTSAGVRRRLPLVGAFCMLSLGFHKLHPFSFTLSTPPRLSSGSKAQGYHRTNIIRMENTVPSIVVYVTVPNKEAGKKLAASIVKEKLAACVNRVPGIESVYLWEGEIQTDSEELLIIKTRESLLNALTEHVKANHEYDVPEVIALPITGGSIPYLEWLKNSTRE
ncbi:putative divalent ion tolerance protein, CutA [Helianthus annuus]|uniref:Divalent ion tolerance protein, CutA n=1 Tax=Helianthus annuus TaxID=4232 RepID=A0A251TTH5_HELAN|nr:protein CutA, chloroplastic [Helianthus annuus]KAF5790052.1 putative divalent ion tolerance protein, CutA [Helianthus annuus]KAJ0525324.1 putative divalent ion tolerance protein, CutA [Helianthus annuus]KAJ0533395.1 putative divalent ion tolerance protein, CutA [Helianthus annuus]KAJ0541698.1 putative divalent ion tolerance protein, CutA [Helianthus annuus]KAJ0706772.1 putative divalent ion tolerance protein, CutA [Helianthus annuus]